MPFENLSPDPDHAFFAAGVHEELLNQLAKISGLSVIARTTMMRYADARLSTAEIAGELNVQTVMEGSVRYSGNRVRIMAQLIDAQSGVHLWSEAYEEDLEDVFGVQLAIATRIASSLDVELSVSQQQRLGRRPTGSRDAYRFYLQALSRWGNLAATGPVHESLDAAIRMDPEFAAPVALKAWIRSIEAGFHDLFGLEAFSAADQEALNREAEVLGHRALALDDAEVLARLALSNIYLQFHDWEAAEELIASVPTDTSEYMALTHVGCGAARCWGDVDLAVRLLDRSTALNPADGANVWYVGTILYWAQQWRAAERHAEKVVQLLPDVSLGYTLHALASSRTQQREAVYRYGKLAEARQPGPTELATIARAYGQIGDLQEARRIFDSTGAGARANNQIPEWQFWIHVAVQEYETAICYLEKAVATNFPQSLVVDLHYLSAHPDFDPVRSHPEFDELVARAATPVRQPTLN
jgi:TolB-like protein